MPLKRELGLWAAIAVVCGESIALGIFLTPAAMAKSLGSPLLLFAVWSVMAVMACGGALCYAELAISFPEAGGCYVYLRHFYGERVAFLYGWMCMAIMDSGLAAALAMGASAYIATLLPMTAPYPIATAALLLLVIAAINFSGTRVSGRFMALVNWLKLIVLGLLIVWAFIGGHGSVANLQPWTARRPGSDLLSIGIAGAFINAFFSYGGWWEVTKLAGEVREPRRTLPRALVLGVLIVTVIYVGLSAAFLYVIPLQQVTSNQAFVAQFGRALFGVVGANVLSVCVLISVLGGLAALTMAAPRVYYAMATNGEFLPSLAKLHPRFHSPVNGIALQLMCSLVVLALGAFDRVISYIIFSAVVFLALTAATVFRLPEARKALWYPVAPLLFIACCGLVALMIIARNPREACLGIAVISLGYPLHWRFRTARNTKLSLEGLPNE